MMRFLQTQKDESDPYDKSDLNIEASDNAGSTIMLIFVILFILLVFITFVYLIYKHCLKGAPDL